MLQKGCSYQKKNLEIALLTIKTEQGFMIFDDAKGKVHIRKGFMDFESFWNAVKDLPTDKDRVFHFRIATSGKISPECCHPFVLSDNLDKNA